MGDRSPGVVTLVMTESGEELVEYIDQKEELEVLRL